MYWPVAKEISSKKYFYFKLWWPWCSADLEILINLGRGHHEEYFCEIILNQEEMWFKDISSRALAAPLFGGVEPFVQF